MAGHEGNHGVRLGWFARRPGSVRVATAVVVGVVLTATIAVGSARNGSGPAEEAMFESVAVVRTSMLDRVPSSGDIEPSEILSVRVGSNIPRRAVQEIFVSVGDRVAAGEVLLRLDDRGLQLDLDSAQAEYDAQRFALETMRSGPDAGALAGARSAMLEARMNRDTLRGSAEREQRLYDQQISGLRDVERAVASAEIAQIRYEAALLAYETTAGGESGQDIRSQEARVAQARSRRDSARLALEEALVRTPVDATVAEVLVKRGDLASQDEQLVSLIRTDTMILRAGVDESDIGSVRIGQSARIGAFGLPEVEFAGHILRIGERARSQGNATVFFVDIAVDNSERLLRWGMSADADIIVDKVDGALAVPRNALRRAGRASAVTVAGANGNEERVVRIGLSDGRLVQILDGLEEGEMVLVPRAGVATGRDGAPTGLGGFGGRGFF